MQKEKVRIYALARELNVESKDLLDLCKQAGFDVKNQLSSLDPDQLRAVQSAARRALDRASAWDVFPTPCLSGEGARARAAEPDKT